MSRKQRQISLTFSSRHVEINPGPNTIQLTGLSRGCCSQSNPVYALKLGIATARRLAYNAPVTEVVAPAEAVGKSLRKGHRRSL